MKRAILIGVLVVLAFAGMILSRFPASWARGFLPASIHCATLGGSLWNGRCGGLSVQGKPVGDIGWKLQALPLLAGKVAADVRYAQGNANATGKIETGLSGNKLLARDVKASFPIDSTVVPILPPGLQGFATADLAVLEVEGRVITALQGRVEARDLAKRGGSNTPYGSYELLFAGAENGEPLAQLRDIGGPLAVTGTLKLTREPGFALEGLVAPRANADPALAQQIQFLGSPDAQGRRPFSIAGTF